MGSPLLLGIAGIAVASGLALTPEYKRMQQNIVKNSRILAEELIKNGITVTYGTSDSHIVLIDCNGIGTGKNIADVLEDCNILVNNCIVPSISGYHEGIRIGTTCITQCDIDEKNVKKIGQIIACVLNNINNINYEQIKNEVKNVIEVLKKW